MGKGIPLGFYTSQWFANWYLQDLDHYIKEVLKVKYYVRYMDDMVCFGSDKEELHNVRKMISSYLKDNLDLELKSNWQVFRFSSLDENGKDIYRDLDFMGFRFYTNRTILRKTIMLKSTRKALKISNKNRPTYYDAMQMLSYNGWLRYTDTYNMYCKWIKDKVNFGELKYLVSENSKLKEAKLCNGDIQKVLQT